MKNLIFLLFFLFSVSAYSGQVASFSFNENTGVAAKDSSLNGNNGIFTGMPVWTQGKFANAVYFNGSTHLLVSNSTSINITTGKRISISFWVKPDNSSSSGAAIISKLWASNGAWPWYQFSVVHYSGGMVLYLANSSQSFVCNGPKINSLAWTHITITHNGSSVKFYTNGILAKTVAAAVSIVGKSTPLTVGNDLNGPYGAFKGAVDELRIYDEVISNTKILEDFDTPIVPPEGVPPTKPANLVATLIMTNSLRLNWSESTDNAGIFSYEISKLINGSYSIIANVSSVFFVDFNLKPSTTYIYKIRAKDINNNFSEYNDIFVTTKDIPPPPPPQIISISYSLSAVGTNTIPYSEIQGAGLYSSNSSKRTFSLEEYLVYPNLTWTITNLFDSSYFVRLKKTNGLESDPSNLISVTNFYPQLMP